MRKIKSLLITAILLAFGTSAFAADATVTFVSGKVEVQRNGQWVALQKGDTVSKSETISTGFQSEAKIKLMESVLYLGPVTRVTLEELSATEQKDNVNVYLKTGTTRSQVKHVDNKRVNYQVHTAVAVASCRGTGFILDDSNTVEVTENTVAVGSYDPAAEDGTELAESDEKAVTETTDETEEETDDSLSDDGVVLVNENQTVTVSDTSLVSNPVTTVQTTITEIATAVTTAGAQEGEGGAGGAAFTPVAGGTPVTTRTGAETAIVIVTLELPTE